MLFSLLVIVLIGAIVYFHYSQGLFAATISAVCAGVAALMAFSYHETAVAAFTGGMLAAYGNAVMLCGLFALIYLILRIVIDNFFAGNVRYPLWLDRVGAPVMGLVAAFFATAIVTIAAQELPFGPTVAGYSPYPVETKDYNVPREFSAVYRVNPGDPAYNRNQVQLTRLDVPDAAAQRQELLVPVDKWFIGLVSVLSDGGSLAGHRLGDIYPDFKTAIYGHRLGMQRSARQTALNVAGKRQVSVSAVFRLNTEGPGAQFPEGVMQVAGDIDGRQAEWWLKPGAGKTLLVLRVKFASGAADAGGFVRFGTANARLVIAGQQYFPIGTLESATVVVAAKPDDYFLAASGVDLVYEVDTASAIKESELASPAFLEFKRFARVDLNDVREGRIFDVITQSPDTHVLRKIVVVEQISARLANRPTNYRSRNEFNNLRARVPQTEVDPEAAEAAAGQSPQTQPAGSPTGQPSTDPAAAPAGESGGLVDQIRDGVQRRNDATGGGGAQPEL
jgi:hypothetical protein